MWYPPFNTGAGYAMGIRAGAEMTTFEMRFIALRCKDTIAPTGTLAQGVGAKQINSLGEVYETKYGLTTSERVYGTVNENQEGRGPCYLRTEGITAEQDESLLKAYLNMAPSQTIKWIESGRNPSRQNVEIEGTEPYIVGGHTASGYWVDTDRATTIEGLLQAVMLQAVVRRSMLRALLQRVKSQGFRQLSILTAKKALRKSAMKIQIIISGKPRNISQTAIHSTPRNSLKRQCRRLWTATQVV